jgi:hypothetical protein
MSGLKRYINKRKVSDKVFAENYAEGYADFKASAVLHQSSRTYCCHRKTAKRRTSRRTSLRDVVNTSM